MATAGQAGSGLTSVISQTATNNTANQFNKGITSQTGAGNTAIINQNGANAPFQGTVGSRYNEAGVTQSGTSQTATITQTRSGGSGSGAAVAAV